MGVDLSKLTYEKENKKDKGEISLFDNEKNRLQKTVSQLLTAYYSCTDHTRKVRLQQEISATINRQLEAGLINKAILNKLKEINLAENNQFFLWHTWFSDVFNREEGKSGFDIVIGNPPYIDSETMTQLGQTELREYIAHHYKYIKGNWDIYMAFLELGLTLSTCLCFITPDKWLSKPFGSKFREFFLPLTMRKIALFTDYLLPMSEFQMKTVNGDVYLNGFALKEVPVLYDYANRIGRIASVPINLMGTRILYI